MTLNMHASVATAGYVVGVDIGGSNLRLALAGTDGLIISRWAASTVGVRDPNVVVASICTGVDALLRDASLPRTMLRSIAAGAPGATDVTRGMVIATSYLMGWQNVPLQALLEAALGVPAAIDNDVNAAALGESWLGSGKGVSDFVFLGLGTGVGAGVVLNNRLFHGSSWMAGEIGYMLVPGTPEAPVQSGSPGALESIIGGEGIKMQWRQGWSATSTTLPETLLATEIFDAAGTGDTLAQTVLERSARILSYAIYNMSLILNCPLFILGGSVGMHPALCAAVREALETRREQVSVEVKSSTLGTEAQLMGAIRLALDVADAVHVSTSA